MLISCERFQPILSCHFSKKIAMKIATEARCAFITFVTILSITSCGKKTESAQITEQKAISVPTMILTARDTVLDREYITSLKAVRNVEIRSHLKGFMEQIFIDEGRWVTKGQTIFRLNDQELRAQLNEAQANIAIMEAEVLTASLEVTRIQSLVDKKVISETESALAKAKMNAAQSRVLQAKAVADNIEIKISYTRIKAPFDGLIDRIPMKVGSLVSEGDLLTTFSDIKDIHAYFEVSENEYLALSKAIKSEQNPEGTPVKLILSDGTTYPLAGKIETMSSEFGQNTGSIAFRAKFQNPNRLLKHGASGRISITKAQKDVVMIPQTAVFEIQDKSYVYVIGKDNIARIRSFIPRTRAAKSYIVQDGLQVGERIATEGVQLLKDGMLVNSVAPNDRQIEVQTTQNIKSAVSSK